MATLTKPEDIPTIGDTAKAVEEMRGIGRPEPAEQHQLKRVKTLEDIAAEDNWRWTGHLEPGVTTRCSVRDCPRLLEGVYWKCRSCGSAMCRLHWLQRRGWCPLCSATAREMAG